MGIIDPTKISDLEYNLFRVTTAKLTEAIKNQLLKLAVDFDEQAKTDKRRAKLLRGSCRGCSSDDSSRKADE